MIRRLNFWQTKLNGQPWINRIPYLLEGIKNGNYRAYISWTNNKSDFNTEK